ncbi:MULTISPECIES: lipoprotein BA_5634 family protein [Bacillus cereus group]|nr:MULTISPECIES: lipoprotein BA_5634 family protein [Bacillus cereus group]KIZ30972.1 hypothetical protein SK30_07695 [Bacillus cereus]MBJ8127376.1 hypothetical protein [Bacillus cereus]
MNKILSICGIGMLVISMLGACSLFGGKKEPETLNGLILLGEQQALKKIEGEHKKDIKSATLYKAKQVESEGKQVFVMDKETAKRVMDRDILRKRDNNDGIMSSAPLRSFPASGKDESILFANKKNKDIKTLVLNGTKVHVNYDSDTWLGGWRQRSKFDEMIVIVPSSTFAKISVPEISMAIVELNKTSRDNKRPVDQDTEEKQTKSEFEFEKVVTELTKDLNTQDVLRVSIIK